MPSSKALENKTLTARCGNPACGKRHSTELMAGIVVGSRGHRRQLVLCPACAAQGWRPEEPRGRRG